MNPILSIKSVSKTYKNGLKALSKISVEIPKGEIFALLGPNGAGKTTLISAICGIIRQTEGQILVKNFDTINDWRHTRSLIGLVPQELTLDYFETVWGSVTFTRGLFGRPANPKYLEWLLNELTLSEKLNEPVSHLSGGMKRRVLIAKALSYEPEIIFLDEPTAGVDVSLRKNLWSLIKRLREKGTTVILTTHYIEEAEEIADRIGIINFGSLLLAEDKKLLMQKMGKKKLIVKLKQKLHSLPKTLSEFNLEIGEDGKSVAFNYDRNAGRTGITKMLSALNEHKIIISDLETKQSKLEEIFLTLVNERKK